MISLTTGFKEYGYRYSIQNKGCYDKKGQPIPWYTYPSIEYLNQFDFSEKCIFEYGCGNSSFFWANRAKKIVSVERNEKWYNTVSCKQKENLKIILQKETNNFINEIDKFDVFDVIIIDDICRDKCAEKAISKISKNGIIIIDNSDRAAEFEEYSNATQLLRNFGLIQVDFYGFGPLNDYTWCTSIFFTKNFNFKTLHYQEPYKGIGNITEKG